MNTIEYDITLNEVGRPCIDISDETTIKPEDKFFAFEICRYILTDIYNRGMKNYDTDTVEKIESTITILGQVSDEMAYLLWDEMKTSGNVSLLINNNYNMKVNNIEELYNLPKINIQYKDKIFERIIGFRVLVIESMEIFELKDGVENINWVKI